MIDDYVRKRLEKEHEFQTAKLKNLFSHIYRDRDEAWEVWESTVSRSGLDEAVKSLQAKPQKFGKLKGRAWLRLLKDRALSDRNRALVEARRVSEHWYSSRMQLDTVEVRVGEMREKVKTTLEMENERQRQREREHQRGRSR